MITKIRKIQGNELDFNIYNEAAGIINNGGLVAFPTETVYGLGANALDKQAVKKIYEAKGRPSDNPLIIHISSKEDVYNYVDEVTEKHKKIMNVFWPGPITLIFKKKSIIPYETSGGLETVAVRFPENEIAQKLISVSGVPIAAPSANSSGKPSPTRASHVEYDLQGKIDMIIDGGACQFGLESTILDLSGDIPCLLRPGSVTQEMIEREIGSINIDKCITQKLENGEKPKAPGMKYTHYSPNAEIIIVNTKNNCEKIIDLAEKDVKNGVKVGIISTVENEKFYKDFEVLVIGDSNNPEEIGANLFKILRKCDYKGYEKVYVEAFDESNVGLAIMNRLKKAAGYHIIK